MSATIMSGKEVANTLKGVAKNMLDKLKNKNPTLAVIVVGNNPASQVYVKQKEKACEEIGLKSKIYKFPSNTNHEDIINTIHALNEDNDVSGILVQLPLPKNFNEQMILQEIDPDKDVDCFTKENLAKLYLHEHGTKPCTPIGIVLMLNYYGIDMKGKHVVIVGRSNIVGKPMALLSLLNDATITVCHSHTTDLASITKQADILIVAVGKPCLITSEMVKNGAVVVDVGINRVPVIDENGASTGRTKLVGDVDFDSVKEVASYISPVPGGVGPLTVAALIYNTVAAAEKFEINQNHIYELTYKETK